MSFAYVLALIYRDLVVNHIVLFLARRECVFGTEAYENKNLP